MKTALRDNEQLIKEGAANMARGPENAGGKLYLTSQRLIFEAHAFNIQRDTSVIELAEVRDARPDWTRFLGFIPLAPNAVVVASQTGDEARYTVFGRDEWAAQILAARDQAAA